jgi:hypothetical protein
MPDLTFIRVVSREVSSFIHENRDDISAVSTLVIAIFTIVLGVATGLLWRATKSLVRGGEDTAKRQLRAYVHVEQINALNMTTGPSPGIQIMTKNFGQTPAREIVITYRYAAFSRRNVDFDLTGAIRGQMVDLAPGQHDHLVIIVDLSAWVAMKQSVFTRATWFYVFGRIDYLDIFGKARWTEFRQLLFFGPAGPTDKEAFVVEGYSGNRST